MEQYCQLYKYNHCFYMIKRESISYFSTEFLDEELDADHLSWLDINGLSDKEAIIQLCTKLKIEKISIENIYIQHRRPKIEEYPTYLYFSILLARGSQEGSEYFEEDQITFFLGKDYLITMQTRMNQYFDHVRERIEKAKGKIRSQNSDFLLYRCMEGILDNYYSILDEVIGVTDQLEIRLHKQEDKVILREIEAQKRKLIQLRVIARPLRDITEQISNSEGSLIKPDNYRYFNNLSNHSKNLIEEIDGQIQILDGLANFYYAAQGQRMNEIMKTLTIVSAIFIPLTFIAGLYGMNFENMPEIKMKNAYFTVLGIMASIGITLFVYFLRRGWIKRSDYTDE
ncbi:MAG: magnesium/cobalt transporter CorA [Bacteroidetes bacterium]|nr:magnesium/cobalt transporter CorA [Bacteroidota bacterium]